jgi:hypothetical protein
MTWVSFEQHGRHYRSLRSTDHSHGQRFYRRGAARPQSRRWSDRQPLIRSEPTTLQDYRMVPDRCRPASACTIRTTLSVYRRSGNTAHRRGVGKHGGIGEAGDGDGGDDDSSDDENDYVGIGPERSIQAGKLKLLQP